MSTPRPGETAEDFGRRLLREHGPPPEQVREQVIRLKRRAAAQQQPKRPA